MAKAYKITQEKEYSWEKLQRKAYFHSSDKVGMYTFVKIDYHFLNSFSFVVEYEYYNYDNKNNAVDNKYDFLSSSLIYQKKNSKFEYKISGTNLLNTKYLNDDSFSQFSTRSSQYTVQYRYVIFSLGYNL